MKNVISGDINAESVNFIEGSNLTDQGFNLELSRGTIPFHYVKPICSEFDPSDMTRSKDERGEKDLFKFVDRHFAKIYFKNQILGKSHHLLILAGSGMGKTPFLFNYHIANGKKSLKKRYPIELIPLGIPDADEYIQQISDQTNKIIFLDGFDEDIKAIQNHQQRFDELMHLCRKFRCIVLTCRTQFFERDEDIPVKVPFEIGGRSFNPRKAGDTGQYGFQKIYITPFTDKQVKKFLYRYYLWRWKEYQKAIKLALKIPQLSVRPMLLAYIPELIKKTTTVTYVFEIYQAMIEAWLIREKPWIRNEEDLLNFSEKLAIDLYFNRVTRGAERIPQDQLLFLAQKWHIDLEKWKLTNRSLLNRDALGNYKFAHRSILEYLYVKKFLKLFSEERLQVKWTESMKMFLLEMIRYTQNVSREEPSKTANEKLGLQLVDLSGTDLRAVRLNSVNFDGADLSKVDFSNASLTKCSFRGANLSKAKFSGTDLTGADLTEADLTEIDFRKTNLTDTIFDGAILKGASLPLKNESKNIEQKTRMSKASVFRRKDLAIHLGRDHTLVYIQGKGVVLNEPSVVACDTQTEKIIAIGHEAKAMLQMTPDRILAVRPLKDGIIADFRMTEALLRHFIKKVCKDSLLRPRVVVSVPFGITEVEKKAVKDSVIQAGASGVTLILKSMAAAIGAGLPIQEFAGNMIVNISSGTTEVSVISLAGIVYSHSIRIAGDEMDEAIIQYIKQKYNLLIGEKTAEIIKRTLGSAYPLDSEKVVEVRGRDLAGGGPNVMKITSEEIRDALAKTVFAIVDAIRVALKEIPPELSPDIIDRGIVLTGGGALLKNLNYKIKEDTGLPVAISDDPLMAVALGTGKVLADPALLKKIAIS